MVTGDKSLFDRNIETGFFPGWQPTSYPARLTVDFGKPTTIKRLRFFDASGIPTVRFYNDNTLLLETKLDAYMQWSERLVDWNVTTLTIELVDIQGENVIREIEFYTDREVTNPPDEPPVIVDPPVIPPTPTIKKKTGVAAKIGSNGFHWITDDIVANFANMRYYMANWFILSPNGIYVQPFKQAGVAGTLGLDDYLLRLKKLNVTPLLCLNQSPTFISDQWDNNPECKPINRGDDPLRAESYAMIARYYYNLAARYGRNTIDPDKLWVDTENRWNSSNEVKSGLGKTHAIPEIEIWNEQWAWWRTKDNVFTPEEYAVMYSVCYDAIKSADPSIKVVMGGMSEMNTEHLDRFLAHLKKIRQNPNIIEVINFHHYSNAGNDDGYMPKQWTKGCSPEQDKLGMRLDRMIEWRNANQPRAQLYYSEFGYDTNPNGWSWQKSDGELNQAVWLTRIYLLGIAKGIDKLYAFNLSNEPNEDSGSLWASSGLNSSQLTGYKPKLSQKMITELISQLNGFNFTKDLSQGDARLLQFNKGRTVRYVYWSDKFDVIVKIGRKVLQATAKPQYYTVSSYVPQSTFPTKVPLDTV